MLKQGKHYAVAHLGAPGEWAKYSFNHAAFPRPVPGKTFLKDGLGLTGMEVSLNHVPAGTAIPFYHRHHANEELYLFLSGQGEMQVDGKSFPVTEGSAVRVAPEGKRAWRNTGDCALVFVVIQARNKSLPQGDISDGELVSEEVVWPSMATP
ncbi:MAG: cupin domain-containing protein [Gammaproteobacteria bacterium]|nr:cupin domain-containing protein [Gammaproteobacteria bacterium]